MKGDFQRKVDSRLFAMRHTARGPQEGGRSGAEPDARVFRELEEELDEAYLIRHVNIYFPLTSERKRFARAAVFLKRALRKLLHTCMGWYLFDIYDQQAAFNTSLHSAAETERRLLLEMNDRIEALTRRVERLDEENRALTELYERLYCRIEEKTNGEEEG